MLNLSRAGFFRLIPAIILLFFAQQSAISAEDPHKWAKDNLGSLVKIYHHFHTHPELSFQEKETAARLADQWRAVGAKVTTGVGGHGVVALLANGKGPTLMLRTDMDALPVSEQTGLPYASQVKVKNESGASVGVMHACGHDVHMTNLVGVARYMAANKDLWRGTLMMIGFYLATLPPVFGWINYHFIYLGAFINFLIITPEYSFGLDSYLRKFATRYPALQWVTG